MNPHALCLLVGLAVLGAPPTMAEENKRSLSLQNASNGHLVHGQELPALGPHHHVRRKTIAQRSHWGTNELIRTVLHIAKQVADVVPGSMLLVGNISHPQGGDLRGSVSHNSGRDLDLGFFATNKAGKPIRLKKLTAFDHRGRAGRHLFDDRRNWLVVKTLLTLSSVQVQWIFVSEALEERLLSYARRTGEKAELTERASQVLNRPGNSSSHQDHFHIRLYCARHERLRGCLNYGPTWPWVNDFQDAVDAHAKDLARQLSDPDLATALRAIKSIRAIEGKSVAHALIKALTDVRNGVRSSAREALTALGSLDAGTSQLMTVWQDSPTGTWRNQILETLVSIGDSTMGPLLQTLAKDTQANVAARILACDGLARLVVPAAVPDLSIPLSSANSILRKAAHRALETITNHRLGRGKRAHRRWKRWWKSHGTQGRMAWVKRGFRVHHDIRIRSSLTRENLDALIPLIGRGGPAAQNVRWLIQQKTDFFVERAHFSDAHLERFYRRWQRTHSR